MCRYPHAGLGFRGGGGITDIAKDVDRETQGEIFGGGERQDVNNVIVYQFYT